MKNALRILPVFVLAFGCSQGKEEYLYDKNDDDYALVQALAEKQCKEGSKIFTELTKRGVFSSYYSNNTYYKVKIKKSNGFEYNNFIKIDTVTADSLKIHYFDSETPGDSRSFTFTKVENDNLITAISNGVCDTRDDFKFSSSGLGSSSSMTFTDNRMDGNSDAYTKVADAFTAKTAYPLPFILWNKTITTTVKNSGSDALDPKTETYAIESITKSACEGDVDCSQAESTYTWTFTAGTITIDTNAYNSNALSSEIITAN